jgi:tetratricopeptide (TPR) repeat protein
MTRAGSAFSLFISPEQRDARRMLALATLAMLAAGCAAPMPIPDARGAAIAPADILRAEPLTGSVDPAPLPDADALGLDPDMRRFIAEHVSMQARPERRLRQLVEAVIDSSELTVEYNERTYTAAEAFRLREANCLSFTNMFIALAREAGLNASYQEVDIPPDWTRSGDMLVLNRHINALITADDRSGDHIVDFNMADFRAPYDRRKISDARAMAHFYSNIGVERMQAGEPSEALRYFRKAIEQEPGFAPAWINLGILYLRAGVTDFARAAWWHALELSPGEQVAMSNLERLYRQQGDVAMADDLRDRIEGYRMRNPYYRYYLAREAFDREDYDEAIGHLKFAVRENKTEDRFLALLGLSYLRRGDREAARRWIARAEEAASEDDARSGYHSKLELLRRADTG